MNASRKRLRSPAIRENAGSSRCPKTWMIPSAGIHPIRDAYRYWPEVAVPSPRPTRTCSIASRAFPPISSRTRGHENPASSRQILNEKRPRRGRHFAIHQFSTNSMVAEAYEPGPSPRPRSQTPRTQSNTRKRDPHRWIDDHPLFELKRAIHQPDGTLDHERRKISPGGCRRDQRYAGIVKHIPDQWRSCQDQNPMSRPVTADTTSTVFAASPCLAPVA